MAAQEPGTLTHDKTSTCEDCKTTGVALAVHGRLLLCPDCRHARRRVGHILEGHVRRNPPASLDDPQPTRVVQRWHTFPDFQPLTAQALNELRGKPHVQSADGNWRDYRDENGNHLATLVRAKVIARRKVEPGARP